MIGKNTVLFSGEPAKRPPKSGRTPGRPTRKQIEARNRELIERALDLFHERGIDGTTVEAILDAVGMSRRTFQRRYRDKLSLFRAALDHAIADYVIPPEVLRAAEVDDLDETLLAVARLLVAKIRSPSGLRLTRIANAEIYRMPEIASYLWEHTAQVTIDYLVDLFNRRLWPDPGQHNLAQDAAMTYLILVVEGSFQTLTWNYESEEQLNKQISYRVNLFINGA